MINLVKPTQDTTIYNLAIHVSAIAMHLAKHLIGTVNGVQKFLSPMRSQNFKMVIFDPTWILPSYVNTHAKYFSRNAEIVPASRFADQNQELGSQHNKVIVARLLSITTPKNNQFGGHSIYAGSKTQNQNTPRRSRLLVTVPKYALLLIFADYFDPPNCVAIFLHSKYAFQLLFGKDPTNAAMVKVGDMFAIKDPEVGANTLGESIHVLKSPAHIVGIVDQGWSEVPIRSSTEANQQVFFDEVGKYLHVVEPELLVGGGDFPNCKGRTCDRQSKCLGCFGKAPTTRPIVLRCNVHVMDCPEYNEVTGRADFQRFTSLAFSALFFQDISSMSRRHPAEIGALYDDIDDAVTKIVHHINQNGGWRVVGWHRRGVVQDTETGDATLSEQTQGHITLLVPTDTSVVETLAFKRLQIATPKDNSVPPTLTIPRSNGSDEEESFRNQANDNDSINTATSNTVPQIAALQTSAAASTNQTNLSSVFCNTESSCNRKSSDDISSDNERSIEATEFLQDIPRRISSAVPQEKTKVNHFIDALFEGELL